MENCDNATDCIVLIIPELHEVVEIFCFHECQGIDKAADNLIEISL